LANKFREITKNDIEDIAVEETVVAEPAARKVSRPGKKGVVAKGLSSVFSGTFLSSDKSLKHLPFILFLALVAVFYIANGYYADDKIREVNKISNQLKELRSQYISTKSELMFASKQSEVAKSAEQIGLKEAVVPPTKIQVDSADLFKGNK
jgi:hypothetical protein